MAETMKALTLWQPWAALIAYGLKTIETRSWRTSYRGPLAIHAALRKPTAEDLRPFQSLLGPMEFPFGQIVAICTLNDVICIKSASLNWYYSDLDRRCGDFTPGRYAWILKDIRPLHRPIPARGRQGLWTWHHGGKV